MLRTSLAALLLMSGTAFFAAPALAQDSAQDSAADTMPAEAPAEDNASQETAPENPVVARVDGEELRQSDLIGLVQTLPPQFQSQAAFLMPQLVQQLVNNTLVTNAGRKADLDEDAEVQAIMADLEARVIRQIYLQRTIDARVTPAKLEEAYAAYLEENPPEPEVVARHILVEDEEAAKGLIVELDGGADFAELAKEHSTGPSGVNGGELPPFVQGDMVPEFGEAAFAMEAGTYSKEPVKTQFGYHIILLEERRMTEPPSLESLEAQLRETASQQVVEELYAELRESAEVEVLFGQPSPEAETAPEATDGTGEGPASEAPADSAEPATDSTSQ